MSSAQSTGYRISFLQLYRRHLLDVRFRLLIFSVLCTFLISAIFASPVPQLTGSYRMTGSTDLGSEIRFTVELNFLNPSDNAVSVGSVSLHSPLSPGHMVSAPANFAVQGHSKAQVTLQFVIPKRDFTAWSTGPHQLFLVRLQTTGAKPGLANVVLLRTNQ